MAGFQSTLYENAVITNTTFNQAGKNRYSFFKRTGKLERSYDQSWISRAQELRIRDLPRETKIRFQEPRTEGLNRRQLVAEHRELLDFLNRVQLGEWEIVFRKVNLHRYIVRPTAETTNEFNHYSIRIRFRHHRIPRMIELGEGHTRPGQRFNQRGLMERIRNIIRNNTDRHPLPFTKTAIILNSGNGGILFHEILGHSLEADYVFRGCSPFGKEHLGKRILPARITLTTRDESDPFFADCPGDDEGMTPRDPAIIKQGTLQYLMSDYFHSRLLNLESCGFCRVDSFENIPGPRMFSLYLQPGEHPPEDLFQSTARGIYAKEFGRGSVDFNRKLFFLNINEAYALRNGRICEPLGAITISGDILEVLNSIEMIGNDFRYDSGIHYCRKNGQSLNVRLGQPSVKIHNILAGGFENA